MCKFSSTCDGPVVGQCEGVCADVQFYMQTTPAPSGYAEMLRDTWRVEDAPAYGYALPRWVVRVVKFFRSLRGKV
jgi:hypothetical protein